MTAEEARQLNGKSDAILNKVAEIFDLIREAAIDGKSFIMVDVAFPYCRGVTQELEKNGFNVDTRNVYETANRIGISW